MKRETAAPIEPAGPVTDGEVLLRSPRLADVTAVLAYGQDPDVAETQWLPLPYPCPADVAQRVVNELRMGWGGRFGLTFVIAEPATDAVLGVLSLRRRGPKTVELAYGVAPAHRNQGIATRAVGLVVEWARRDPSLERAEIRTAVENRASQRVAEKAGFIRGEVVRTLVPATGREYDDVVYFRSLWPA